MKIKIKKYIYLINDITNILLKKNYVKLERDVLLLRKSLIIVIILFIISVLLNIYFIL